MYGGFQGGPQLDREMSVSRTAIRLIVEVFAVLDSISTPWHSNIISLAWLWGSEAHKIMQGCCL